MQYKITTENDNPFDTVIERSGKVESFTLRDTEANLRETKSLIRQWKGQKDLSDATMQNIETHHPFVLSLSPQDLLTVHMYAEAKSTSRVIAPKIEECEQALAKWEEEKQNILEQIPSLFESMTNLSKGANKITKDMFKIIDIDGKFTFKEVDADGNSVGSAATNPRFDTAEEAQAHVDALVEGVTPVTPQAENVPGSADAESVEPTPESKAEEAQAPEAETDPLA